MVSDARLRLYGAGVHAAAFVVNAALVSSSTARVTAFLESYR